MDAVVARNGRDTTSHMRDDQVQGRIDLSSKQSGGFEVESKLFDDAGIAPPATYH